MESPDLNMKGTPVLSTLADTRIPREASTVRRICGLSSGQIYDVMAWKRIHLFSLFQIHLNTFIMSIPVTFFSCGRPTESLASPVSSKILIDVFKSSAEVCQYLRLQDGNMFS